MSLIDEHNSVIQFLNFQVKESHIVFLESGKCAISINFTPKGTIKTSIHQFILGLEVHIKDTEDKFHIDLITESIFSYKKDVDVEELKRSLFIVNAPAIVFPYIRAYISSLSALSGMPTLTLPTLNLMELGDTLKDNLTTVE